MGLTGGTGAGKTSALRAHSSRWGARCIDCDAVYHEMLRKTSAPLRDEIR